MHDEKALFNNSKILLLNNSNEMPPPPYYVPKNMKQFQLLDDPLELARQLTIMNLRLYVRIKHSECLNKVLLYEDSEDEAANFKACIEYIR